MAVEHLISHGGKRIVCIATNSHLRTIKGRIAGYEESMRNSKLPRAKSLLLSSLADTKTSLSELFASRNRPDGLFTANNASTIWVIETLREMNIKIGKDVSLVGFDDIDDGGGELLRSVGQRHAVDFGRVDQPCHMFGQAKDTGAGSLGAVHAFGRRDLVRSIGTMASLKNSSSQQADIVEAYL